MIKQNKIKKNIMALFLVVAMIVTTCPQLVKTVHAAEPLDRTKFATAEELKQFNTNNNDGATNPAKVYFGNNNQKWWIAGSQGEKELTLFAESPLATSQQFEPNYSQNKTYSEDWKCTYTGENPGDVYPNHYGASPLRTTLKGLESSHFTSKEQDLMKNTTVYTDDTKNSSVYSTTDKLYLAYGDWDDDQYVTVGKNTSDSLNNGLRIDKAYWGGSTFWLRAPHKKRSLDALVARPGYCVSDLKVYAHHALAPAFELNLSSVIFASAASAASSDGALSENDAFTLRHQSQANIGTATISQSKGSIAVTDVTNKNTYLVVQNSNGAWAKKVSSKDLVFAGDMDSSLNSFENCKVWLETTSENITYAEEATQGSRHNMKVNVGENLTVSGGNILQTNVSGNITEITVEVNDGYYLPDGYENSIQGLNGLNVKDVTQTGFTISGTPTSDVNIQLPAATPKPVSGSGSGGGGSTVKLNPVYRAYNPNNGEHLYTLDEKEYKHVASVGWDAEGVAFMAEEEKNGQALYRVYNPNSGLHHYTLDEKEKNTLVSLGWRDEKVAWYTSKKPQSAPVYRVYNPNDGNHHYTMNQQEKDVLVLLGWHDEGIAFRTAPIE